LQDLALKKFQIPEENEEDYYLLESVDESNTVTVAITIVKVSCYSNPKATAQ